MANRGKKNTVEEVSEESDTPVKNTKQKNMKKPLKLKRQFPKLPRKQPRTKQVEKRQRPPRRREKIAISN